MAAISNTSLAATLAAAGDQWSWCEALIAALGSSRTVEFKTFSAVPSNWETGWAGLGATFYAAPLTGTMSIEEGAVGNLGVVGIPSARANAVLSTGFAAMRISGGGNWRQATVGLAGATGYDGQPVDIVLRKNPNGTYGIVLNSAKFRAPSALPRTVDNELYRHTLVNDTGADQPAGFVTQTFGTFFEQGEVASYAHPYFRVSGGQVCPSTQFAHVRWPDGSLRWMGAMIVVPQAVAAGASVEVQVRSGGPVPAASSRALANVASLNINVLLGGVTTLTGDWVAQLNDAVAVGGATVVKLADGAAGAIWRVRGDFFQAGNAHGQLNCDHFVQVLQDATGQHAGTRYLGRVGLPWCDVGSSGSAITGPAAEGMEVTAALRLSASTVRQLQGMNASSVLGNTILLPHYGSIATCGTDAMYDFFPGTQSAECRVRVKPAGKKASRAKLAPPFDYSKTPTPATVKNYVGHGSGSMSYATNASGERGEIALVPEWAVRYAIGDPANSEREVRVNAMATTGWCTAARRKSTGEVVVTANMPRTYSGLGPNQPTWRWGYSGTPGVTNFALPVNNEKLWYQEVDVHHRGAPVYAAYLFTAEPQYLDLMVEQAANFIAILPQGAGTTWNTDPMTAASSGAFHSRDQVIGGTSFPGAGILFRSDLERYAAWGLRDVLQAGAIYPNQCPYGTEVKQYLRDVADNNLAAWVAYRHLMPATYRANGITNLKGSSEKEGTPWCMGYLSMTFAHASNLVGTANALECAQHMANFWSSIDADPNLDFAAAYAYLINVFGPDGFRVNEVTKLLFGVQYCTVNYTAATNQATFASTGGAFGFANGDVLRHEPAGTVQDAVEGAWLYIINKSGMSFQVSLTPGGPPATILQDASDYAPKVRIANFAPGLTYEQDNGPAAYLHSVTAAIRYLAMVGCSGLTGALAEASGRLSAVNANLDQNPKNAYVTTLPAEA